MAMDEVSPSDVTPRRQMASLRAAELAGRQWGVIGHEQLRNCGVSERTSRRWRAAGRLHSIHRGVHALGHRSIPIEGRLVAALLHAGPLAVLSHRTAAWWWGLIDDRPSLIEVSTPGRTRSLQEVLVHHPREIKSTTHRRFPITTVPQTLLDFAAKASLNTVRNALAKADYLGLLDVEAVEAVLGSGRPGSATLRNALKRHQPRLADTRSRTERMFISLCESAGVPVPEVNVKLHGWRADFLWRTHRLVVETDGYGNHHTSAQIDRDHRKDLALRAAGLTVNRYSRQQVEDDGQTVIADVLRTLARLAPPAATPTAPAAATPTAPPPTTPTAPPAATPAAPPPATPTAPLA
jgi:predicted transcriptional regulator of viral defense system